MFSSKKAVFEISDVPEEWIFEHYLKLTEKLHGQDIKLTSVFNPKERTPSMYIYICKSTKSYKFKCFSTGLQGGPSKLVMLLYSMEYSQALNKIVDDYRKFLDTGEYEPSVIKIPAKWNLESFTLRDWNKNDVDFWSPYNIGSKHLEKYMVRPISHFSMHRDGIETFERKGRRIYGYFNKHDELYRIYQPENENKKFMIIKNYIQGWDQLTGKPRLFICSSLKDIMSLDSLNVDGDFIAPSSENSGLEFIMNFIKEYPEQYVIFDNDTAGIKMMHKYKEIYDIPFIHIPLSKDISDSVRDHGAVKVKSYIKTLIPA